MGSIGRRCFLASLGAFTIASRAVAGDEFRFDIAIVGGGVGGVAAALAAARNGYRVALTEETDWIGGQLTSQAVPPDEHRWIESFGCTQLYRQFRNRVRGYYRENYSLTADARARWNLNPGNGLVSRLCGEPRVSLAVLNDMLAPYVSADNVTLFLRHKPIAVDIDRDTIRAVRVKNVETGIERTLHADYFLDATETGELLPLARIEFVTGSEARSQTGEEHASERARPDNQQSFTYCFGTEYRSGEDHTIDRPRDYAFWRDYVPKLTPPWPGKLLSWDCTEPGTGRRRALFFDPTQAERAQGPLNLWLYRRIIDKHNFAAGTYSADVTLVNWPQSDYWLGNLIGVSDKDVATHRAAAKQLSLSLLYWMQTEAPRSDGGQGWRGLRLLPEVTGTEDGLAKYPYIRESRRILAEFTVLEKHISRAARGGRPAEKFADSVGVGWYNIDLHPTTGGDNYFDTPSVPFQIPLGSLIPRRAENLIAASKNIGVTHITNGAYRLHPIEWNIGESAGELAVEALRTKERPSAIRNQSQRLTDFQTKLKERGVELEWPSLP
ncbi:MAG TPA: FAD-dependent oxidoreductase [Bryobacteraceae bacterium]|nr:FAD-dependent oxidoreductase [Bryobacteraceae bacterium]